MNIEAIWRLLKDSEGPIVAVALHTGHSVRHSIDKQLKISEAARFREEDPYTGAWVDIADTGIVVTRSRFEVDLNRPREKAVYRVPSDAWGLDIWKGRLPDEEVDLSLKEYDAFYDMLHSHLKKLERKYKRFFVYDLHSYNHRRGGSGGFPDNPEDNPEINIGTGTMDREHWKDLVDGFIQDLLQFRFMGRHLDVRENVKFKGGGLPAFVHSHFPESGCVVSVEVKKFWMDEWTGMFDRQAHQAIHHALASTVGGVRKRLTAA